MTYDPQTRTFDCEPTLNDSQVVDFCREGHTLLRGVVPDDINQRTCEYLEGRLPANPSWIPEGMTNEDLERIRTSHAPSTILLEDWFLEHVLLNPQVSGAIRSLLGRNFGLPVLVGDHRCECPQEAQRWHHDADHVFGPELNFVEVFYFPQDTPAELGPSEIAPSTHIRDTQDNPPESGVLSAGPASTVGIHHQSILHRRGRSTGTGTRHMLKYSYWRTVPPERDWVLGARLRPSHRQLRRSQPGPLCRPHLLLAVREAGRGPPDRRPGMAQAGRQRHRAAVRFRDFRGLPAGLAQQVARWLCLKARRIGPRHAVALRSCEAFYKPLGCDPIWPSNPSSR